MEQGSGRRDVGCQYRLWMRLLVSVTLLIVVPITGCRTTGERDKVRVIYIDSTTTNELNRYLVDLQTKMEAITNNGGFAAIGVGESALEPHALDKARMRARSEVWARAHREHELVMQDVVPRPVETIGSPRELLPAFMIREVARVSISSAKGQYRVYCLAETNPRNILWEQDLIWRDGVARTNMTPREYVESSARFKELKADARRYYWWMQTTGKKMLSTFPK